MRSALTVAAVVGLTLNVINQGSRILARQPLSWPHVALNFLVPFCVATYSAARSTTFRANGTDTVPK